MSGLCWLSRKEVPHVSVKEWLLRAYNKGRSGKGVSGRVIKKRTITVIGHSKEVKTGFMERAGYYVCDTLAEALGSFVR